MDLRKFYIKKEPIELYKILKIDNQVQSGGEAKFVISESLVKVNGEVETRKAKKIYSGDIIDFEGDLIKIVLEKK
ncbi:MAG: RNA-binding S4 domain-containing protein [Desulforegulaceae bacterium]|nr:RNA-binding S4 domain-containing protein [Desulforegulaceae bacterium]